MGKKLGKVGRIAAAGVTFGTSELVGAGKKIEGGLSKDGLFGKKETTGGFASQTAQQLELDRLALSQAKESGEIRTMGLARLRGETKEDAGQIARAQVARAQTGERASADDARRRLQSLVARRGLQGSSIGLGQEVGLQRSSAQRIAALQASTPERERAERQAQTGRLLAAGGSPQRFRGPQFLGPKKTQRTGGLAPLIGAGVGAYFGGAAGAQVGAGVGQASGSVFG